MRRHIYGEQMRCSFCGADYAASKGSACEVAPPVAAGTVARHAPARRDRMERLRAALEGMIR